MNATKRKPTLFLDDGHPESRDCDQNYRALEPVRREPIQRLMADEPRAHSDSTSALEQTAIGRKTERFVGPTSDDTTD